MEWGGGLHRLLKVVVINIAILAGVVFAFNVFVYAVRVPNLERICETKKTQEVCLDAKQEAKSSLNGLGSSFMWLVIPPVLYLILIKFVFHQSLLYNLERNHENNHP